MNFFRKILSKTLTEVNTSNLIASSFIYEGTKGDVSNMKSIYMIFIFYFQHNLFAWWSAPFQVDRDSLVRKKALYLLNASLNHYFSSTTIFSSQLSNNIDFHSGTNSSPACTPSDTGTGSRGHVTMTKRERYANEEAESMGVGEACNVNNSCTTSQDRWRVLILLYEMLEEYGTHLVEAAWTHQVSAE